MSSSLTPAQSYVLPLPGTQLPGNLTQAQFIQTVMAGVSGLPGDLVRPKWQPEEPKQPDLPVDWMGIGISTSTPDANSYVGVNQSEAFVSQRHELLEISCDIYGPNALETTRLIRDGFQVPANLGALRYANMGFVEVSQARRLPDLVNERWIDRYVMSVFLRAETIRTYPVLTLVSASGTIYVPDITADYMLAWTVPHS